VPCHLITGTAGEHCCRSRCRCRRSQVPGRGREPGLSGELVRRAASVARRCGRPDEACSNGGPPLLPGPQPWPPVVVASDPCHRIGGPQMLSRPGRDGRRHSSAPPSSHATTTFITCTSGDSNVPPLCGSGEPYARFDPNHGRSRVRHVGAHLLRAHGLHASAQTTSPTGSRAPRPNGS